MERLTKKYETLFRKNVHIKHVITLFQKFGHILSKYRKNAQKTFFFSELCFSEIFGNVQLFYMTNHATR